MNTSSLCKSCNYRPTPVERYYSNRYMDVSCNRAMMNQCNQINHHNHLQNSYSNPRFFNRKFDNISLPQCPPQRMQLEHNYSSNNIRNNTPKNNYINNSKRPRGENREMQLPNQNNLTLKMIQIEKKMNQIEKQSQRIEAFNDSFFKLFPNSSKNNIAKGQPRFNRNKSDSLLSPRQINYSMSKMTHNDNKDKAIDEEYTQLKQEIGKRLARIREKQKLQTDAIQYILKHSGNPNFYSNYMNC